MELRTAVQLYKDHEGGEFSKAPWTVMQVDVCNYKISGAGYVLTYIGG
jgi:hypothetical protein